MRYRPIRLFVLVLITALAAQPREVGTTYNLLKRGAALSSSDVKKLEARLQEKADDQEARIQLLSYYSTAPATADITVVKAARLKHILWVIQNDPKDGMGLFQIATGVYRMNCQGDSLADPDGFQRTREAWFEAARRDPKNERLRRTAIRAIEYCAPEQAESLLVEDKDAAGLGHLFALATLGVTGESYTNGDPSGSDSVLRDRPFAVRARREIAEATNAAFLTGAAETLMRNGAILWADGKLDWDYTSLGNSLLTKAKAAAPDAANLLTLPTALPARGERPPDTLRVGGNIQQKNLVKQQRPVYPIMARDQGIQGTVKLTILIGLDGKVLHVQPIAGPAELVPAAVENVFKWVYKPTLLNGKPCYIVTTADVNYNLR